MATYINVKVLMEKSFNDLLSNTKTSFDNVPRNTRTVGINIIDLKYSKPSETELLVNAVCKGETDTYQVEMLFTGVDAVKSPIPLSDTISVDPIDGSSVDVKVRCSCMDFYYTFSWYNLQQNALSGEPMPPYTRVTPDSGLPPKNPREVPGMCKHIIRLGDELKSKGVIK